jgi:DNA-binding Xre family transcriptional regulator
MKHSGGIKLISFEPLKILLIKRNISKMDFIKMVDISPTTSAKMWKNEYVAMKIIDDICNKLECELTDVIQHIPDHKFPE